MAIKDPKLLKELGDVMALKIKLAEDIEHLGKRELELYDALGITRPRTRVTKDKAEDIREAIISVLKDLRNNQELWIKPGRITHLVGHMVDAPRGEIERQIRALPGREGSNVAHNNQNGSGSAYFYVGLDQ